MANILFICPNFFDYPKNISSALEKQGHKVVWYDDRPSNGFVSKVIIRLKKDMLKRKIDKYLEKILKDNKDTNFDYVLCIFGQSFEQRHIKRIREQYPNAKYVYYAWDSIKAFPFIKELYPAFDVVYSFDDVDCKEYNLNFLPLFYSNDKLEVENKYDCCAIQTIKVGKLENFEKIKAMLPTDVNMFSYLYLQSKLVYLYYRFKYKIFKKYKMKDFSYKKLTREENNKISNESKIIIDCQMKNQVGLTIRTFEALHLKKKLITSNKNIMKYEFYTPNNIYVIDENSENKIPNEFFESDFDKSFTLSRDYSLDNFVKKLLD